MGWSLLGLGGPYPGVRWASASDTQMNTVSDVKKHVSSLMVLKARSLKSGVLARK